MSSENNYTASKHYLSIDVLNILACFSVIILHCSGCVTTFKKTAAWGVSLFLQTVAYWAVAAFFMISGATLLGYRKKYSTIIFLKKRFQHVILPFLLWSTIYLFYNSFILHWYSLPSLKDSIYLFLNNKIVYIFYFFYDLIGIYFIVPVVSILAKDRYKKLLCGTIILEFFAIMVRRDFVLLTKINITGYFEIPLMTGYMCFFLAGWYLFHYDLTLLHKKILYALGIASFVFMFSFTFIRSYQLNKLYDSVRSYFSICNFFMATSVFVFIKNINFEKRFSVPFAHRVKILSSASFGVYLVQMIYLPIASKLFQTYSVAYLLLAPIVIYTICVATVLIVKKIPVIKYIFP